MDPLTHTFFGAALADSGWAQRIAGLGGEKDVSSSGPEPTPGATRGARASGSPFPLVAITLILGANLPDVDFVTYFIGQDLSLYLRRGWTHGILAMVVLPLFLAWGMGVWGRSRARRSEGSMPPDSGGGVPAFLPRLVLACLAVWSHPTLDWLNTYGVRLLMPFDGRWFYGDVLFIIEPWIWLLLGGGVFLRHSKSVRSRWTWASLALLMSLAVLGGAPGLLARSIWVGGLVSLVLLRSWPSAVLRPPSPWPARVALSGLVIYVVFLAVGDRVIESEVRAGWPSGERGAIEEMMVGPLPADPLRRDVLVVTAGRYHFYSWDWRRGMRLEPATPASLPQLETGRPEIEAALAAPCVRGMANWMRFPFAEVESGTVGTTVYLLDARYTRRRTGAFGGQEVVLDGASRPHCDPP